MTLFETNRLLIRHLTHNDASAMFVIFSDSNVTRWMGDGSPLTRELCEKWIEVSLHNYDTKGFVYDSERQEPEIIYAFQPNAWGKGYASELVPAMLTYGLDECKLDHILATIDSENKASQHIVQKAGMKLINEEYEADGHITLVYRMDKENTDAKG